MLVHSMPYPAGGGGPSGEVVMDFVAGTYSINGVSKTLAEVLVIANPIGFPTSTFGYDDISAGVGWVSDPITEYSAAKLTTEAFAALGTGGFTGTISLLVDVAASPAGNFDGGFFEVYLENPDDLIYLNADVTAGFPATLVTEDYPLAGGGASDTASPTAAVDGVSFTVNFEYSLTGFSANVNGGTPVSIAVLSAAPTLLAFAPRESGSGSTVPGSNTMTIQQITLTAI